MAGFLSRLNPVPAFPEYTGPHRVGTVDVEIPVSALPESSPMPEGAADVHTVLFRVFYPAVPESKGTRITWLPAPQRMHVAAYSQFLGMGALLSSIVSFLPRHLHFTSIPVYKNATLLRPESEPESPQTRWPTVMFSHGLGGNRNAYSQIAGSLASHGMVVICPEHRDGSAALSLIRDPKNQDRLFMRNTRKTCPYDRIPHGFSPELWNRRNDQLRIRLWELGLGFEAILGIDRGDETLIQTNMNASTPKDALHQFSGMLDVQEPGKVIFAGHSFGAASIVQLLKSTFYAGRPELKDMADPLFVPNKSAGISKQITPRNPAILLDMWCFPLLSAATAPLYNFPMPCYANTPSAPGGSALLAIESDTFFKWKDHLHVKARILSPDPTQRVVASAAFERPDSGTRLPGPNFFYVEQSAHLSQSDFGVLFPWLTRRVFGAEKPERCLRLNLRAELQFLRENGYHVARTWVGDIVDGADTSKTDSASSGSDDQPEKAEIDGDGILDDKAILRRSEKGLVEAWKWIDIVGLGEKAGPNELEVAAGALNKNQEVAADVHEREMEGEMEPALASPSPLEAAAEKTVQPATEKAPEKAATKSAEVVADLDGNTATKSS